MADTARREFMLGEGAGTGGGSQNLKVNLGPSHPAMHGIIRITAELDGEVIVNADVEIGYLHRAFEKDCEVGSYNNAIPYTDRLRSEEHTSELQSQSNLVCRLLLEINP